MNKVIIAKELIAVVKELMAEEKVFDVVTAEEWRVRLNAGIKAPVVGVRKSTLGGPENVALLPTISLDERKDWPNGILENSRYFHIELSNDGMMEMFGGNVRPAKFLRKTRVRDVDEAIAKLNQYIAYVSAATTGIRTGAKSVVSFTFSELEEALKYHDWTYAMSDDHSVWSSGLQEEKELDKMIQELVKVDPHRVEQLYNKYGRIGWGTEWRNVSLQRLMKKV